MVAIGIVCRNIVYGDGLMVLPDLVTQGCFEIELSAPSKSAAWPICEQKRDLILTARKFVRALEAVGVLKPWVEESLDLLQTGGEAWTTAEKAKIADLNWRIVARKP